MFRNSSRFLCPYFGICVIPSLGMNDPVFVGLILAKAYRPIVCTCTSYPNELLAELFSLEICAFSQITGKCILYYYIFAL